MYGGDAVSVERLDEKVKGAACSIRLRPEVLWVWAGVATVNILVVVGAILT